MAKSKLQLDRDNQAFMQAWDIVNRTNVSLFLTGKAGTGKTTFLKLLKEQTKKRMIIAAPTGVAAINAGGTTLHSMFGIPFGPFVPGDHRLRERPLPGDPTRGTIYSHFTFNRSKLELLQKVELLVIDEISMVRCDLLDVVDKLLRVFAKKDRRLPFGGVQVLLIGDPFQLPPIAQPDDWEILAPHYPSRFFFHALSYQALAPIHIELTKVYRQKDADFIQLLNRVRVGKVALEHQQHLNSRQLDQPLDKIPPGAIVLATHRHQAERVNRRELDRLTGTPKLYLGIIKDDFPESMVRAPRELSLKVGAQVMFVKNDTGEARKYYNGMLGEVLDLQDDKIIVGRAGKQNIEVERDIWQNIRYVWNEESKAIEEEVLGTYTQFPLTLAWAITVHKSQGLTFDRVIADLGQAFEDGQVYVALSRCTSFAGLSLTRTIPAEAIRVNPDVRWFSEQLTAASEIEARIQDHQADQKYRAARKALQEQAWESAFQRFFEAVDLRDPEKDGTLKRFFLAYVQRNHHARDLLREKEQLIAQLHAEIDQQEQALHAAQHERRQQQQLAEEREAELAERNAELYAQGRAQQSQAETIAQRDRMLDDLRQEVARLRAELDEEPSGETQP
ncbi:MAG: AAA family ATPase [Bacteroidota bacterium]